MGREPEQTALPRSHADCQQIYEKMLNVTSYKGDANGNHSELPPHTCLEWLSSTRQVTNHKGQRNSLWRKGSPHSLLVGM